MMKQRMIEITKHVNSEVAKLILDIWDELELLAKAVDTLTEDNKQLMAQINANGATKKPLLADARVGDLCQRRDGKWVQIDAIRNNGNKWSVFEAEGHSYHESGNAVCGELYHTNLDIISTEPLAPIGSAEWAWQMAKLGTETKCSRGKIRISKSGMIEVCYNGLAYAMPMTQSPENSQYVISKMRECSPDGWQLYEPKADHIADTSKMMESQFEAGDWVEKQDRYGNIHQDYITAIGAEPGRDFMTTHKTKTLKYDRHTGLALDGSPRRILRKLSPSEVIVRIGCLSGTVRSRDNKSFHLLRKGKNTMVIYFDALDTPTRELVQSLLKAQKKGE